MTQIDQAISISLTQFTNFALKAGPAQLTAVRAIKKQHAEPYSPPPDPYKRFREGVIAIHKKGMPKDALDAIVDTQTDPNKMEDYPELVRGYKSFWGRKTFTWFQPPKGAWDFDGLRISIKPELGLITGDDKMIVKLYPNKPREMDKRRAALVTQVMQLGLGLKGIQACVLDVRAGKLFPSGGPDEDLETVLRAQARSFVEMYRRI